MLKFLRSEVTNMAKARASEVRIYFQNKKNLNLIIEILALNLILV